MLTFAEAGAFYIAAAERILPELEGLVGTVVMRAAVRARGYIGHQQDGWDDLSTATTEGFRHESGRWIPGKIALGYGGAESPLLRTGQMEQSIEFDVDGLVGTVGSSDRTMLYQEMGTPFARYPIPPRPVLARGLMEACGEVELLAEEVCLRTLVPGRR